MFKYRENKFMKHFIASLTSIAFITACGGASKLDTTEARDAFYDDATRHDYISECATYVTPTEENKKACEDEKAVRKAGFRFELVSCKNGAPEVAQVFGSFQDAQTCTVRWQTADEPEADLRSSIVLYHVIDEKLQAKLIDTAR